MDGHSFQEFLSLPVNPDEVWQGGVATLAERMDLPSDQAPSGAGVILWRSTQSELVHAKPIFPDDTRPLDQFVDAMLELSEEHDFPYRPARIDCNDRQLVDELSPQFDGTGTVVHYRAKMGAWNALLRDMAEHMQSAAPPPLPSLRDAGCTDEQIGRFAAAAADFYRAKLWELLDDTDLIKIESPKPSAT